MLDIIVLLMLALGFFIGAKRGLAMQALHIGSMAIASIVAIIFYKALAEKFVFWVPYPGIEATAKAAVDFTNVDADMTFYRILAFAMIYFAVIIVGKIIVSMFDYLAYIPFFPNSNRIGGAILGIVEMYAALYIMMYLIVMLPFDFVQARTNHSVFANFLLEHTPVLAQIAKKLWYVYM